MRRKNQQLSDAETIEILQSCTAGVLAVSGDNDYPYAVPLSYAYEDGKLYFHFATQGHKLDAI
ncbi:MAG: pyridoxamine 5'-phosphate oxidase family protein, partial [Anaerolineaceae bacterium]